MSEKGRMKMYGILAGIIVLVYLSTGSMRRPKPRKAEEEASAAPVTTSVQAPVVPETAEVPKGPAIAPLTPEEVAELNAYLDTIELGPLQINPFAEPVVASDGEEPVTASAQEKSDDLHEPLEFKIQGVCVDSRGGRAVIDRTLVSEGDTFRGYTIVSIGRDQVVLRDAYGKNHTLTIEL